MVSYIPVVFLMVIFGLGKTIIVSDSIVVNTLVTTYPQRIRYRSLKGDYSPLKIHALGPPFASSM